MRRDVYIRLKGGLLEKLIDKALEGGMEFASIRRTDERTIMLSCDIRSADKLLNLCRQYRMDAKILHLHGFHSFFQRIKARWTIFPALLIAAVIMLVFFTRIWRIDIAFTGTVTSPHGREKIIRLLEENGIYPGVSSSGIRTDILEKQLLAETGDFSFIGVRVQGARLLVEASPENPSPDVFDISSPRDLVAARDGIIESIDVYSGTACVSAGDTVRKGQILILGEEQKTPEETAAVSALGKVEARCWFEGSSIIKTIRTTAERTGSSRSARFLRLFKKRIELGSCESFPSEECVIRSVPLVGLFLPVELEIHDHFETRIKNEPIDEAGALYRAEALARADALSKIDIPENRYSILKSWVEKDINDHTLGVRAVYEISTDIAASRDELAKEDY